VFLFLASSRRLGDWRLRRSVSPPKRVRISRLMLRLMVCLRRCFNCDFGLCPSFCGFFFVWSTLLFSKGICMVFFLRILSPRLGSSLNTVCFAYCLLLPLPVRGCLVHFDGSPPLLKRFISRERLPDPRHIMSWMVFSSAKSMFVPVNTCLLFHYMLWGNFFKRVRTLFL